MSETEFSVNVKIDILRNGAMVTTNYPERGAEPAHTTQRVYRSYAEFAEALSVLWTKYAVDSEAFTVV